MTEYLVGEEYFGFKLILCKKIAELDSVGYMFKHIKSGARVLLISNSDNNKVFSISFRTPPYDDTGLPHILEHSVLCGSRKFPLKDPFNELVKGSLNTFLNAMTFSDKTMYPVASCNDKDFANLMDVYLDAVFYPNIYDRSEIFKQEGWHYELLDKEEELQYKGVVYNEMKGVYSSPEQLLFRKIQASLLPDTIYSFESGGDPEAIPTLTTKDFLNFHRRYYHPANSYIYLYGDFDIEEKLLWLDKKYLSDFGEKNIHSDIELQKEFAERKEDEIHFSLLENESEENKSYLSYNFVVGTSLDVLTAYAFDILEYVLLEAQGAILKKRLIDAGIGKDVFGSYDREMLQPIFSVVAKDTDKTKQEEFKKIVEDTLADVIKEGIDRKKLESAINIFEFKLKEADFGRYPKGLIYGMQLMSTWLYDETKPFDYLEYNSIFDVLKAKLNTDYYEKLIEKYLINNNHANVIAATPQKGLSEAIDEKTAMKLSEYKKGLADEELDKLVDQTKALIEYQETPNTPEELATIPLLDIADIDKKAEPLLIEKLDFSNTRTLLHRTFTNNIVYLKLVFDLKKIPFDLVPYVSLLSTVLGAMDTDNFEYSELSSEINLNTGGIDSEVKILVLNDDAESCMPKFIVGAKAFSEKISTVFDLITEILFRTKFVDKKRLYEIIAEQKSRMELKMQSSGHVVAANRAQSYFSQSVFYSEYVSGIEYFKFLEDLEGDFEAKSDEVIHILMKLIRYIFRRDKLLLSITTDADENEIDILKKEVEQFSEELFNDDVDVISSSLFMEQKNEAFVTASKVQYVAQAGNFLNEGYKYSGVLKVLSSILSREYLWNNVRVIGGAYGCMCGFSKIGNVYFTSYRDPNLKETIKNYSDIVEYLQKFDADERDMTKFIIGTISDIDVPKSPAGKGVRSLIAYLSNVSYEDIQQERDEVLATTSEDIRKSAELVKAVLAQNNICVVGGDNKIKENDTLFREIKQLFK